MRALLKRVRQRKIVINALRIALVVGTILNIVNQGSQFISGLEMDWFKVGLNYLVPYCVASYSAAKNEADRELK